MAAAWLLILALQALPATDPIAVTASVDEALSSSEDLEVSCSLGCAVYWTVEASSASKGHPAALLNDEKLETAWIAAGHRASGESITFRFPQRYFSGSEKVRFDGFLIISGYAKTQELYLAHARPRTLRISRNGTPVATATLHDQRADQRITFPDIYLTPGDAVELLVTDVFPGQGGGALAITEIVPEGAH